MKINHVGYLVKNIDKSIEYFNILGFHVSSEVTHDEIRKIDIVFMTNDGYTIELVSPYDKDSVVSNLMKYYKNCPYHICYEVDEIESSIDELQQNGFVLFEKPEVAPAFNGRKVCFLQSARIGMVELVESDINKW